MQKRGLTLIEMLAAITIISIIILLIVPSIISFVNTRYHEIAQTEEKLINAAVELYIEQNARKYPLNNGDTYCFLIEDLVQDNFINVNLIENSRKFELSDILQVEVSLNKILDIHVNQNCQEVLATELYHDDSGATRPLLSDNLIPIVNSESGFVKANLNEQWYDYDNRQWANAVLIKEAALEDYLGNYGMLIADEDVLGYFVWIPRYRYQLFNTLGESVIEETIAIKFEVVRSAQARGDENDMWLTHPAFIFGDLNLKGFWIGKYTTTGSLENPSVLPNETMLLNNDLADNYLTAINFKDHVNVFNARLARNLEWGAVALLSRSIYGNENVVWNNPNDSYTTGCAGNSHNASSGIVCNPFDSSEGVNASTTGNVYGVYDMSGGAFESVMNAMYDLTKTVLLIGSSNLDNINQIGEKYIDKYEFGITSDDSSAYERRILGDATSETRGWDGSNQVFITDDNPFFLRGGDINNSGIFSFDNSAGNITSGFRLILSEE